MNATLGSFLFQASAKPTAAGSVAGLAVMPAGWAAEGDPFAALLAAFRGSPNVAQGGPLIVTQAETPAAGDQTEGPAELLGGVVALTLKAQQLFETAQSPQAKTQILNDFVAALRARLSALDAAGGATPQLVSAAAAAEPILGALDEDTMQAGPVAIVRKIFARMGLDADLGQHYFGPAKDAAVVSDFTSGAAARPVPPAPAKQSQAAAISPEIAEASDHTTTRGAPSQHVGLDPTNTEGQNESASAALLRKEAVGAHVGGAAPQRSKDSSAFVLRATEVGENVFSPLNRASPGSMETPFQNFRPGIDAPPSPALARHVAVQINGAHVTEGSTRIELTPRGLGDIEIDMRHDEVGKLRIVLKAENPAVLNAFRHDRELLLDALRDGGISGEEADLSFETFAGHQSRQQSEQEGWRSTIVGAGIAVGEKPATIGNQNPSVPTRSSDRAGLDIIT